MSQLSNLEGQASQQIRENIHSNTRCVATLPHYPSEKRALNSTDNLPPLGARAPEVPPSWYFTVCLHLVSFTQQPLNGPFALVL